MEIDNWITQVVSREDKAQTSGTKKDVVFLFGIDFYMEKWRPDGSIWWNWTEASTGQEWLGKRSVTSQWPQIFGHPELVQCICEWRMWIPMWFTAWYLGATRMVCIGLKDGCNACGVNWRICSFLLSLSAFSHLARGCLWWKTQWYIVPCHSFKSPVSVCGRTIQKPPLS